MLKFCASMSQVSANSKTTRVVYTVTYEVEGILSNTSRVHGDIKLRTFDFINLSPRRKQTAECDPDTPTPGLLAPIFVTRIMGNNALESARAQLDKLIHDLEKARALPCEAGKLEGKKNYTSTPGNSLEKGSAAEPIKSKAVTTKTKSEKKPQKSAKSMNEVEENFDKCLLQVGILKEIEKHPASDKLFVCKLELNAGVSYQVITGLQKFYTAEELANRKVVVICNLKPAKLAGFLSEAMILAGSVPLSDNGEIVKVLDPPPESNVGDRIFLEGGTPSGSPAKQLSSKVWDKVAALLKVEGGIATYNGKFLVTSDGHVHVSDLPDGAGIH